MWIVLLVLLGVPIAEGAEYVENCSISWDIPPQQDWNYLKGYELELVGARKTITRVDFVEVWETRQPMISCRVLGATVPGVYQTRIRASSNEIPVHTEWSDWINFTVKKSNNPPIPESLTPVTGLHIVFPDRGQ